MSKRAANKRSARVVREQLARERRRRRTLVASIAAGAALLVAGVTGFAVYAAQRPDGAFPVPASATVDRAGLALGTGPVTVEIYLDYLCPACRAFEQDAGATIDQLVASGRITLVYHPAAILDGYSTNKYSSRSAAGAGCAADAGKLAEYTKALYADQPAEGGPGHTDDRIVEIVGAAGVTSVSFGQCLRESRYADWVVHVTDAMSARGVNSTPTVFVNGSKLANPTAQALTAAVGAVPATR
jgi:protein-disulfide isomerase